MNAGLAVSATATAGLLIAALLASRSDNPGRHTATVCIVAVLWCIVITGLIIGRN